MAPHIIASAARRSALAVLVGFWLTLVIWVPPPNENSVSVLQEKNVTSSDDNESLAIKPSYSRDLLREISSLSSASSAKHVETVRLQRRALPLTDRGLRDPPMRHHIEEQAADYSLLQAERGQNFDQAERPEVQRHREDVTDRVGNRRLHKEVLQKRNSLKEEISSTKELINEKLAEVRVSQIRSRNPSVERNHDREVAQENEYIFGVNLDNVFISVKTTKANHRTRCPSILQTWFQLARNQVSK